MSSIDNRVVQMEFDNKEFAKGIQDSLKDLENLKKGLDLKDSGKSLEQIGKIANTLSFASIASGVQEIASHFTFLGRTVDRIFDNIASKIQSVVTNTVRDFTIEPMVQGFEEYELKMGSIQTIMAGTGESLKTVSNYLNELNTYADKTIYSFSDMTSNIGKFTNAGVDLERSVRAIQGVSNLAAVSGANAQEASRAMYNFAQALSAGYVKLIDWKSIENANMATVEFKQQLIDTAVAMGTLTERADGMYEVVGSGGKKVFNANKEFNEYLKDAWLTNDVLIKTLGDYANEETEIGKKAFAAAQDVKTFSQLMDTLKEAAGSGWAQTWELIIGDFDQAKELFTNISNVLGGFIDKTSDARNDILQAALGTQTVTLSDWRKLQESGIVTETFRESIIASAKAHGVAIDKMISDEGSFWETLDKGWLTLDILNDALETETDNVSSMVKETQNLEQVVNDVISGRYGNGEDRVKALTEAGYDYATVQDLVNKVVSGQAVEFEVLSDAQLENLGYTEEQIETFKELRKQAEETGTPLNELIASLERPSGRDLLIESFANAFKGLISILGSVGDAYRDIFPPMTSDRLYGIIEAVHSFSERLIPAEDTLNNIRRTFRGLFAVLDIVGQGIKFVAGIFGRLVSAISPLGGGILSVTGSIGDFLVALDESIKSSEFFGKAMDKVQSFIDPVARGIKWFVDLIKRAFNNLGDVDTSGVTGFVEKIKIRFEPLTRIGELASRAINGIINLFKKAAPVLSRIGSVFYDVFKKIGDAIFNAEEGFNFNNLLDVVNTGLLGSLVMGFRKFFKSFGNAFETGGGIIDSIKGVFEGLGDTLSSFQDKMKSGTLLKIAIAVGILAASLVAISMIDSDKLTGALAGISVLFAELIGSLTAFEKISGNWKGLKGIVGPLLGLATAVLLLSFAMKNLAKLDWEGIAKGLVGIAGLSAVLVVSAKALSSSSGKMMKGAIGLIAFAGAISMLANVVKKLSDLSWEGMAKGLVGVGVLCAELALFLKVTDLNGLGLFKSIGLIALAGAVNILAIAVAKFAAMDTSGMIKGLAGVGAVLLELGIFSRISGGSKNMISIGIGLTILSGALHILSSAIIKMGSMSWDQIGKGLATMAGALTSISVAMRLMPKGAMTKSVGLIGVATALLILNKSLSQMSAMSWEEIAKGLVSLAGALTIISVAMIAMRGAISGAAAILVMSVALLALVPIMKALGGMKIEELGKALSTLAGVFVILGVAGGLLGPMVPAIMGLTGAIALLGVGMLAAGVGILAFSAGLAAISVSGTAAAVGITAILSSLAAAIPAFIRGIGEGIIALCEVIAGSGEAIFEAVATLIVSAMRSIREAAPEIIQTVFVLIQTLADNLAEYVPIIGEALFELLIGAIDVLEANMPKLVKSVYKLLKSFVKTIFDIFGDFSPENLLKATGAIAAITATFVVLAAAGGIAKKALGTAAIMVGVLAAITLVFLALGSLDPDSTLKIAESLSLLLLSLSASLVLISMVPAAAAAQGLASLAIVVGGLTALIAALGAINQIPGFQWLMSEGASVLKQIGEAIGGFFGGIVGGAVEALSSTLPKIGSDMTAFMENAKGFFDGVSGISANTLTGVGIIADSILKLTASELLDALAGWITGGGTSLSTFGDQLVDFGPKLMSFAEGVSGISEADISNAANALKTLLSVEIPKAGGLVQAVTGETNFAYFGAQLASFGPNLAIFASSVSGISTDGISTAAEALKTLLEVNVPKAGGLVQIVTGEANFAYFGAQLASFGPNLATFASSVSGIDLSGLSAAAEALGALMSVNVPKAGGLVQAVVGESNFAYFGAQLASFGPNLASFASSISGIEDVGSIESALEAIRNILALEIPETGGFIQWFTGQQDFGVFGEQIGTFGTGLSGFFSSISGFDGDSLGSIMTAIQQLVDMSSQMTTFDPWGFMNFGDALANLGALDLSGAVSAVNDWNDDMSLAGTSLGESAISGFSSAISDGDWDASKIGKGLVDSFKTSISSLTSSAQTTVRTFFTAVVSVGLTRVKSYDNPFKNAGSSLVTNLKNGISSQSVTSNVNSIMNAAVSSLKSYYSKFYGSGQYLIEGFIEGMKSRRALVETAAKDLAEAANAAFNNALSIESPSRETMKSGRFFDEGFIIGLMSLSRRVANAASEVGLTAMDSIRSSLSGVSKIISEDLDAQPTISPVVDLTNVTNAANGINRIFNQNGTIQLGFGMGSVTMNALSSLSGSIKHPSSDFRSNQEDRTGEIVEAIDNLKGELQGLKTSIASMKVVMETGALVGQIENQVDQHFGIKASYKERGI